jgi:uncharacterized membrane protein (UPF0127 family)
MRAILLMCSLCLTGCSPKSENYPAESSLNTNPTQAQPKLPTIRLFVGDQVVNAEFAHTLQAEITGMMFRTNLTDQDAMFFIFPYPGHQEFWGKNCDSLDVAYINPAGLIVDINTMAAGQTNPVPSSTDTIQFALETRNGWFKDHNLHTGTIVTTDHGPLTRPANQ